MANKLQKTYKKKKELNEREKSHKITDQLKKCLTHRFQETKTVLERYQDIADRSPTKQTLRNHLNELEKLGEAESKYLKGTSKGRPKAWKLADKPIEEVREDHSTAQSEGIPEWLEKRIEQVIQDKLDTIIEYQLKDGLADEFEEIVAEKVRQEIKDPSAEKTVSNKEDHKEKVYGVLEEDEWFSMPDIMEKYQNLVDEPKTSRTIRTYIKELEKQGKAESKGSKKATRYRRCL